MALSLLSKFFNTAGTLFIAYAALRVHHRVLHDRKLDRFAFMEMRREQVVGVVGVVLIAASFLIDFVSEFFK